MGLFDQLKTAQDLMKNMSPEDMKRLMSQANTMKDTLREQVSELVEEEIAKRQLVTRDEVEQLLSERSS
ncbi:MAG: hypothetical protein WC817_02720 [Patescibacteria group bacterium]|jgi:predicted transcriptional regulator